MENVKTDSTHFAAILLRGGKDVSPEHETLATFDFWKFSQDFQEIMASPADRLVFGSSKEEVEQTLVGKYPTPHGFSMLLAGEHYVPMVEEPDHYHGRRRRRYYESHSMTGWRVMTNPVLTEEDWQTEEAIQTLSMEYNGLWIDSESYRRLGGEHHANNKGFVVRDHIGSSNWHPDWVFIRFNPRNFQNKAWRAEKAKIEKLLEGKYPDHLLDVIGQSFSPANWPHRRGFTDCLTWDNRNDLHHLLQLMVFAKKFAVRRPFWRKHTHYPGGGSISFKGAVDQLLVYTYGVVKQAKRVLADKNAYIHYKRAAREELEFTQWLKDEARAMKLKMPDCPVVPPRPVDPFAGKRKKRNALDVVMPEVVEFPLLSAAAAAVSP